MQASRLDAMADDAPARFRIPRHTYAHIGVFLTANLAFLVIALVTGGGFWWAPITVGVWGAAVLIDVGFGAWMQRRAAWEDQSAGRLSRFLYPGSPLGDRDQRRPR